MEDGGKRNQSLLESVPFLSLTSQEVENLSKIPKVPKIQLRHKKKSGPLLSMGNPALLSIGILIKVYEKIPI